MTAPATTSVGNHRLDASGRRRAARIGLHGAVAEAAGYASSIDTLGCFRPGVPIFGVDLPEPPADS